MKHKWDRKKGREYIIFAVMVAILVMGLSFCSSCARQQSGGISDHRELTVAFVGDIMMHDCQIKRSYQADSNTFDVSDSFSYMKDYLKTPDIMIGNLETTLAGQYQGLRRDCIGYSGYPTFNSPEILAKNLKDAGFDLVTTANNHCLDSGLSGLQSTIEELDKVGLMHIGTGARQLEVLEVNGITIGLLSYTYDVNFSVDPKNCGQINTLNGYEEDSISELIEQVSDLRRQGTDFVCVLLHWGTEYQSTPDEQQRMLAKRLMENGVDLIVGSHPHVVQPIEAYEIEAADGNRHRGYVCYSLGDFLSGSSYGNDGIDKDLGCLVNVKLVTYVQNGIKHCEIQELDYVTTCLYWTEELIAPIPVVDTLEGRLQVELLSEREKERLEYGAGKEYVVEQR